MPTGDQRKFNGDVVLTEVAGVEYGDLLIGWDASTRSWGLFRPGTMQVPCTVTTRGQVNILANPEFNSIDPNAHTATIAGGGFAGSPNQIGVGFAGESGTYGAGNLASWSVIGGSYDNISNQTAGTIAGGAHHRLHCGYTNSSANHGTIGGGSTNTIKDGAYCTISGGGGAVSGNLIDGDTTHHPDGSTICGGRSNTITNTPDSVICGGTGNSINTSVATPNSIGGGSNNSITGSGGSNAIAGGRGNSISGGSYNAILGGDAGTISASGGYNTILGGLSNTISSTATQALVHGDSHSVTQNLGFTFGKQCKPVAPAALTFGARQFAAAGDCQAMMMQFGVQTTDATLTNMVITAGGTFCEFDDAKTTIFTGQILLQAVRPSDKAVASYQLQFTARWDGTTETIYDAGGNGTTRNLTVITNPLTLVTAPLLALNTGSFRPKVTGLAATNITWTAVIFGTLTFF